MKKTLIAFAALAAVGAASAQATISGNIAAGYLKDLDGSKGLVVDTANFKFSVSEDLGGGMKVSASQQFAGGAKRKSAVVREDLTLGVSGGFGSVTFANTRAGNWAVNGAVGSTWSWNGLYDGDVYARPNIDALGYTSPSMNGANFVAGYSESSDDGAGTPATKSYNVGVRYAAGPLSAGARVINSSNAAFTSAITKQSYELYGTYDLGVAKLGLGYDSKRRGKTDADKASTTFGVAVPMGPVSLGLNYAKRDKAAITEFGITYDLSKRTSVYTTFGQMKNAAGVSKNQSYLVVSHTF